MEKFRTLYDRHISIKKEILKTEHQIREFLKIKQKLEEKMMNDDF